MSTPRKTSGPRPPHAALGGPAAPFVSGGGGVLPAGLALVVLAVELRSLTRAVREEDRAMIEWVAREVDHGG